MKADSRIESGRLRLGAAGASFGPEGEELYDLLSNLGRRRWNPAVVTGRSAFQTRPLARNHSRSSMPNRMMRFLQEVDGQGFHPLLCMSQSSESLTTTTALRANDTTPKKGLIPRRTIRLGRGDLAHRHGIAHSDCNAGGTSMRIACARERTTPWEVPSETRGTQASSSSMKNLESTVSPVLRSDPDGWIASASRAWWHAGHGS
jgi:hypothetical protein